MHKPERDNTNGSYIHDSFVSSMMSDNTISSGRSTSNTAMMLTPQPSTISAASKEDERAAADDSNNSIDSNDGTSNRSFFPPDYEPGSWDVICQRGKTCDDHVGNRRFRMVVENHVAQYMNAKNRQAKSDVITSIVKTIRRSSSGKRGGFVMKNPKTRRWQNVDMKVARDKVGNVLRDAVKQRLEQGGNGATLLRKESSNSIGSSTAGATASLNKSFSASSNAIIKSDSLSLEDHEETEHDDFSLVGTEKEVDAPTETSSSTAAAAAASMRWIDNYLQETLSSSCAFPNENLDGAGDDIDLDPAAEPVPLNVASVTPSSTFFFNGFATSAANTAYANASTPMNTNTNNYNNNNIHLSSLDRLGTTNPLSRQSSMPSMMMIKKMKQKQNQFVGGCYKKNDSWSNLLNDNHHQHYYHNTNHFNHQNNICQPPNNNSHNFHCGQPQGDSTVMIEKWNEQRMVAPSLTMRSMPDLLVRPSSLPTTTTTTTNTILNHACDELGGEGGRHDSMMETADRLKKDIDNFLYSMRLARGGGTDNF